MKKMLSIFAVVAVFGSASIANSQTESSPTTTNPTFQQTPAVNKSLLDVVSTDSRFTTFTRWLRITGQDIYLKPQPIRNDVQINSEQTSVPADKVVSAVFIPTDAAISKLPKDTVAGWEKDPEQLKRIVRYHLIVGKLAPAEIKDGLKLKTLLGEEINVTVGNGSTRLNDATLDMSGTEAKNGSVYVIDTVLVPPAKSDPGDTMKPSSR